MGNNYNEILSSNEFTVILDSEAALSSGAARFQVSGRSHEICRGLDLNGYLEMPIMQKPGVCIYEDVLVSALTAPYGGEPSSPIWGLPDGGTLELLLCQKEKVVAFSYSSLMSKEKAAYLRECLNGPLQELPVIRPVSREMCRQLAENAFYGPHSYTLDTCSLKEAFSAIGMKREAKQSYWKQLELLQSRHMLTPFCGELNERSCHVSPFGRQCGLLMRNSIQPNGYVRRELRVLLPAMDAFCQGVDYTRSRALRVDDGKGLAQRLRRISSAMPSSFQYQREVMPGAVERLREVLTSPPELPEGEDALCSCSAQCTSYIEAVSRLACEIESYDDYRNNPDYSGAVRALAHSLDDQEETPAESQPVAPLAQRLKSQKEGYSKLAGLTLSEYLQGLAILGKSSFIFWLYQHSLLPTALRTLHLHLGSTLGELYQAAVNYYVKSYQNDLFYLLLIQPVAAIAPYPEQIPCLDTRESYAPVRL